MAPAVLIVTLAHCWDLPMLWKSQLTQGFIIPLSTTRNWWLGRASPFAVEPPSSALSHVSFGIGVIPEQWILHGQGTTNLGSDSSPLCYVTAPAQPKIHVSQCPLLTAGTRILRSVFMGPMYAVIFSSHNLQCSSGLWNRDFLSQMCLHTEFSFTFSAALP